MIFTLFLLLFSAFEKNNNNNNNLKPNTPHLFFFFFLHRFSIFTTVLSTGDLGLSLPCALSLCHSPYYLPKEIGISKSTPCFLCAWAWGCCQAPLYAERSIPSFISAINGSGLYALKFNFSRPYRDERPYRLLSIVSQGCHSAA